MQQAVRFPALAKGAEMSLLNRTLQPLKNNLRSCGIAASHLPIIRSIIHANAVRDALRKVPALRSLYQGFGYESLHPFDRAHGTETSGFVSEHKLPRDEPASTSVQYWGSAYWGSQPSFVRAAIAALPSPQTFTFIDLGCGKGRALIVASEFPFRDIIGVELSPTLAKVARKNVQIIENRFPGRTRIVVQERDASTFRFPSGNLVVYIYNPFGKEVLLKVVAALETALAAEHRDIYVIYMHPVLIEYLDASPVLGRYFEATAVFAPEEVGYGHISEGRFVIWRGQRAA
jgi:SAM-dependent methyltransferase